MEENKVVETQQEQPSRIGKLRKFLTKARVRTMAMLMTLVSMLSISAFAADGDVTVSELMTDALPVLTTSMSSVWSMMTSNPVSKFALGCAIAAVGFRFLRKAIKISHKA